MFLDIPLIADLHLIQERCQAIIDKNLIKHNSCRRFHDYQPQDSVLLKLSDPSSMEERFTGPFKIESTHVNGTITIRQNPHVTERLNIRWVKPYHHAAAA